MIVTPAVRHVALELVDGVGIDVEDAQPVDAENRVKGARLKLRLGAKADQRHCAAVRPREMRARRAPKSRPVRKAVASVMSAMSVG